MGYALAALPESRVDIPWQRVINSRGEVSPRARSGVHRFQQDLLEAEGVILHKGGRFSVSEVTIRQEGRLVARAQGTRPR